MKTQTRRPLSYYTEEKGFGLATLRHYATIFEAAYTRKPNFFAFSMFIDAIAKEKNVNAIELATVYQCTVAKGHIRDFMSIDSQLRINCAEASLRDLAKAKADPDLAALLAHGIFGEKTTCGKKIFLLTGDRGSAWAYYAQAVALAILPGATEAEPVHRAEDFGFTSAVCLP